MREDREAEADGTTRQTHAGRTGRNPGRARMGASTPPSDAANRVAHRDDLIKQMTERGNMKTAWKKVRRNGGSAGIDGRDMDATLAYLNAHWETVEAQLLAGTYRPDAVKRVEIKKSGGGIRKLGVPTVLDRVLQQAALQILSPIFDPLFSEHSYGFRPGRSAGQAVEQAQKYQHEGKNWVVDMDLKSFFDEVNHDLLMARVRRHVKDKAMLKLIRSWLKAGVMVGGLTEATGKGTPQGGPLSPLLSNIMLDDLDKELERRGHSFCRYADDCNIYVATQRSGERVLASITTYLETKLKLKINHLKSAVDRPSRRIFLGYSFTGGQHSRIRVPKETATKMKSKLKDLFRQARGRNVRRFIEDTLNPVLRGWTNYFRLSQTKTFARELDEWLRHRLRCVIWRQWKRPHTRYKKLVALGLNPERARKSSFNGRGAWFNSGASHMNAAIPRKAFAQMNLLSVYDLLELMRAEILLRNRRDT